MLVNIFYILTIKLLIIKIYLKSTIKKVLLKLLKTNKVV